MARRRIGQEVFGFAGAERGRRAGLDDLAASIDWTALERLLAGIYAAAKGEQAWPPLALFKALLLGLWHDLSDVRLAEALDDRASFRRFCGFAASEPVPTVYSCVYTGGATPWYLVRTSGPPEVAAAGVRAKLRELEPTRTVYDVASLDAHIGNASAEGRLRTMLLTAFAATALTLELPLEFFVSSGVAFTLTPHADIGLGGSDGDLDRTVTELGLQFGVGLFL